MPQKLKIYYQLPDTFVILISYIPYFIVSFGALLDDFFGSNSVYVGVGKGAAKKYASSFKAFLFYFFRRENKN